MPARRLIPMVQGNQIFNTARVIASWRYSENPGSTYSYIEIYGVNKNGEHSIAKIDLKPGTPFVANGAVGSIFTQLIGDDYPFVSYEFKPNGKKCRLHSASLSSTVSPIPETGDAVTEI